MVIDFIFQKFLDTVSLDYILFLLSFFVLFTILFVVYKITT